MSFNKYSTNKIADQSAGLAEEALRLRALANDMVSEAASGDEDAFQSSIEAASLVFDNLSNRVELAKIAFAELTAELSGVDMHEVDENGEVEVIVETDAKGQIKF